MAKLNRIDPYMAYCFKVEIASIIVAGFTEVSGLSIETQLERKTFGGENDKEYAFITGTKHSDIVLKKGVTYQASLWNWYNEVAKGSRVRRLDGSIYLLDQSGELVVGWDFHNALPIKWEGPTLNSTSNAVAIETLVLAHQGLKKHGG